MIGGLLAGGASPWIGEGFGLLRVLLVGWNERQMMKFQASAEERRYEREFEIEELKAISAGRVSARKQPESWGVKLLDAAAKAGAIKVQTRTGPKPLIARWALNLSFVAFSVIDWMISSVRPVVAYLVVGSYVLIAMNGGIGGTLAILAAVDDLVGYVMGFYFGERTRRRIQERRGR